MSSFPWLPLDTNIDESIISNRVLMDGEDYQILDTKDGNKTILLIKDSAPWLSRVGKDATQRDMLVAADIISSYSFDDENYWIYVANKNRTPTPVENLIESVGSMTEKLSSVGSALSEMSELFFDAVFCSALFLESEKICIAIEFDETATIIKNKRSLATRLLVGAVLDTNLKNEAMKKINPELSASQIKELFSILGVDNQNISLVLEKTTTKEPSQFSLPGRPELEQFFRDHIIDYFHRYKEYQRMGINPPNGILLYGPPGTGKTYSVQKLADFLEWKVFDIDMGTIGSPYIHQTSKVLKDIFDQAIENAPSLVLMEEIDALAGSRSGSMNEHKIEEISQLLRLIETASKQGVLVIGTTNRFESMDQAIVRRGRFDHVIELGFPSQVEILSAVENLLKGKPVGNDLNLEKFSNTLIGHPMSDIAWAINDAARFAVKNNKKSIDNDCLMQAAKSVLSNPRTQE